MDQEEIEKYLREKEIEQEAHEKEKDIDIMAKREHLKRQYLRFYQMERKIKDPKKQEQISRMKRQMLRIIGRE